MTKRIAGLYFRLPAFVLFRHCINNSRLLLYFAFVLRTFNITRAAGDDERGRHSAPGSTFRRRHFGLDIPKIHEAVGYILVARVLKAAAFNCWDVVIESVEELR